MNIKREIKVSEKFFFFGKVSRKTEIANQQFVVVCLREEKLCDVNGDSLENPYGTCNFSRFYGLFADSIC